MGPPKYYYRAGGAADTHAHTCSCYICVKCTAHIFKENSWAHGSMRWLELLHRMQPSQESAHTLDDVIAVIFALWLKRHCLVVDKGAYLELLQFDPMKN